jgi:hypothetical protein
LEGCLSFSLKGILNYFSTLKNILRWYELTCFFDATYMPLNELYMINPFLACVFGFTFNIGLLWQRIHHIVWGAIALTSLLSLTQ